MFAIAGGIILGGIVLGILYGMLHTDTGQKIIACSILVTLALAALFAGWIVLEIIITA